MYLVSRHEDLMTVLLDPIVFSQELGYYKQMAQGHLEEMKDILVNEGGGFFPDVANIDPPRHTRVRRLLSQAFSRRRMKAFEPQFESLVDELIDGFVERGEVDGLHDLAMPMAIAFSMQQLQVDDLDMSHHQTLGQRLFVAVQSHQHPRADGRCGARAQRDADLSDRPGSQADGGTQKTTCSPTSSPPVPRTRNP